MRTLMRWDPFGEFGSLRRAMERVFDEYAPLRLREEEELELGFPVDVYEKESEVVVKASLPGVNPEDVEISVTGETLSIKGESRHEEKVEKENYYRHEIRCGAFSRMVTLPAGVSAEGAEATFKDGLLTVTLPKVAEAQPRRIKVRSGEPVSV